MNYFLTACLFAILSAGACANDDAQQYDVKVGIELQCPMSPELQNFIEAIPLQSDEDHNDYAQWSRDFVLSMKKLIELVESGEVGNASFTISVSDKEIPI
jgi:hypothetical protein